MSDNRPANNSAPRPSTDRRFAEQIVQQLRESGYEAYWAGGCVRDQLLGRTPKDYDVATSARPDEVRAVFGKKRTLAIGAAFGVITVRGGRSAADIEVATFRQDADYSDGRRPDAVVFCDARADALRRDFTINGMFYDPGNDQVLDFVGGQQDLERQVIRAIGVAAERIAEDKLRMLRAVRFATTFRFAIEAETFAAIVKDAHQIRAVSVERIANELIRTLCHSNRSKGLRLLRRSHLGQAVAKIAAIPLTWNRQQYANVQRRLSQLQQPSFDMVLTILLLELQLTPSQTESICRNLKLSGETINDVLWQQKSWQTVAAATEVPWPELQRVLIDSRITRLLACVEATGRQESVDFCRERLTWPSERLNPPPIVDGNDLKQWGLAPGPQFKQLLTQVRDLQLIGRLNSPEEARHFVLEQSDSERETS